MSLEALEIIRNQRLYEVENSPFAQEFTIVGAPVGQDTFKGTFDHSYIEDGDEDKGHIRQRGRVPRISVASIPAGIVKGVEITFESKSFHVKGNPGLDDEGVPVIWLV